jgi:hypothetical protein
MPPQLARVLTTGIGIELIYSFVIIVASLMVYYGTRELYELSSHKGIKYFRQAFLFFAIAYSIRFFIKFILVYANKRQIIHLIPNPVGAIILFIFIYASAMAIFSLVYSLKWKKWRSFGMTVLHILAGVIALIAVFVQEGPIVYLLLNFVLFGFIIYSVSVAYKNRKKKNTWYLIYLLLSVFWLLNIVDILIPDFIQPFQFFIYLASLGAFLIVFYKVLRKSN